eukprot:3458495-Pleurochrysis_carterae.AAC.1
MAQMQATAAGAPSAADPPFLASEITTKSAALKGTPRPLAQGKQEIRAWRPHVRMRRHTRSRNTSFALTRSG